VWVYLFFFLRGCLDVFGASARPLPEFFPSVSILKPVKGADPEMYGAFASHCSQDYPGEYEIVFGVQSMEDPAVEAVERLRQEFPERSIRIVLCADSLGTNGKVSNLVQMLAEAKFDHVLIDDSDIHVSRDYLRSVMASFAWPSKSSRPVGMVTALYRGRPHGTLGSRLEALGISTDFMAGVLTSRWLEKGTRFGLGSTLACTREALDAIGGLLPLVDHLADDYELGARIARAGFGVEIAREVVETSVPAYSFKQFWTHQLRWSRGIRDARPLGHLGLAVTFGVPWALANLVASAGSLDSIALLSCMVCVRVAVALIVGVAIVGDSNVLGDLWLLPLRDCVALAVWLWSYAGDSVMWRGERFRLRKGKLVR
jgi:ceramide glucosyltransferase